MKKIKACITEVERFPVYDICSSGVGFDKKEAYLIDESLIDWICKVTDEYDKAQDFLEAVVKKREKKRGNLTF